MKRIPWAQLAFVMLLLIATLQINLLAQRYQRVWDLSNRQQNSLHPSSVHLLQSLDGPVAITAFVPDYPLMRAEIRKLIDKYQRHYPDLKLVLVDPSLHPAQARKLGIRQPGQLLIEYQGKSKLVPIARESEITNALAGLSLGENRWIVEIDGHGEPSLLGNANHDLGSLGKSLRRLGYPIFSHQLLQNGAVPDNTGLLVLASPRSAFSEQERRLIIDYLADGGNMLWLADPDSQPVLADYLNLHFRPGVVVDAAAADLGIDNPAVAIASRHGNHPISRDLEAPLLFPVAQAIATETKTPGWQMQTLFETGPRSWNETGPIKGRIDRDPVLFEHQGPLAIGALLTRKLPDGRNQQLVVIGDSDFLSNAYIGNGANQVLGIRLVNILSENPQQISLPVETAGDRLLHWSPATAIGSSILFLFGIPLILAITGIMIRFRRSRG